MKLKVGYSVHYLVTALLMRTQHHFMFCTNWTCAYSMVGKATQGLRYVKRPGVLVSMDPLVLCGVKL